MEAKIFFRELPWSELTSMSKNISPVEGFLVTQFIPAGSTIILHDNSRLILAHDVNPENYYGCERKYVRVLDSNGNERKDGILISSIKHVILNK
jgi:hypothetical protein